MTHKGYFITLEGGEGVGKSTQAQYIKTVLEKHGHQVVLTREPGGCDNAEAIRDLLVKGEAQRWDLTSEYLLFSAARREHLLDIIWPALERGSWVVCDRFYDSSRAYQGAGRGLDNQFMQAVYQQIAGKFEPDLTLILDMPVNNSLDRTVNRPGNEDRFEKMTTLFHQRVRQEFLNIAETESSRCQLIDADQAVIDVSAQIHNVLKAFMFKMAMA